MTNTLDICIFLFHSLTLIISIPCTVFLFYIFWAVRRQIRRPSNQLTIHAQCWLLYFVTSFFYSTVALSLQTDFLHFYELFHFLVTLNLCSILLIPLAMLLVTVDRLFSLWKPKMYYIFNTDMERRVVQLGALFLFSIAFSLIFLMDDIEEKNKNKACYLVTCFHNLNLVCIIVAYKLVCGVLNIILSLNFAYMFLVYTKTRKLKQIDANRNRAVILLLFSEITFNIFPSTAYFFIDHYNAPFIFAFINLDALLTMLAYFRTFKRMQLMFKKNQKQVVHANNSSNSGPKPNKVDRKYSWQAWN